MRKLNVKVEILKELNFEVHPDSEGFKELKEMNPDLSERKIIELVAGQLKKDNEWISEIGRVPNQIQFGNQDMIDINPFSGCIIIEDELIDVEVTEFKEVGEAVADG